MFRLCFSFKVLIFIPVVVLVLTLALDFAFDFALTFTVDLGMRRKGSTLGGGSFVRLPGLPATSPDQTT